MLIDRVWVSCIPDADADASYLEQDGFESRLAAYRAGEFGYVWIEARAEVTIYGVKQVIHSGGVGGVEDDHEPAVKKAEREELHDLAEILRRMGFLWVAIDAAYSKAEVI